MKIKRLILKNFRNFPKKDIQFSPSLTIILGKNAAGKTNILEAIFMLSTGKSFRDVPEKETVAFGNDIGRIKVHIENDEEQAETELELVITQGEVMGEKTRIKKYLVNGVNKRMVDFTGILKTAIFWPQDMELVTGTPSRRRKYLDFVLIQTDREYRRNLVSFERGLRQRNKVLEAIRDSGAHRHQLLFWDQLLIKSGDYINRKREEYIGYINKSQITNSKLQINSNYPIFKFQIKYDHSIISRQRLDQYASEEVAAGVTLVGPHRDDIQFTINNLQFSNNRNLAHFGSRGEQRLAILWLKLCELSYIHHSTGDKPALLLDDIYSELDHDHRDLVYDLLWKQQTIITTTDRHFIPKVKAGREIIELGDM